MHKNLFVLNLYLESVKKRCSRSSKQELTEIILGLAKEVPAKQRPGFLEAIDRLTREHSPVVVYEQILRRIEALKAEIGQRIASIQDGTYCEDHYQGYRGWDHDYHRHSAFPRELDSVIAASGRLH